MVVAAVMVEGGDGEETKLKDYCVGKVCDQNRHWLPIRLPLIYLDSEGGRSDR